MLILGLNAYHADSAACIMKDGCLVAAVEEERFRRIKHWAGLPTQAIDYCLHEAGAKLTDVDHIAVNRKPGANNWRRLGFVLTHLPDPRLMWQKIQNIRSASSVAETLEQAYGQQLKAQIHHVEHHLAHLASAVLLSGFDEAACLSVDGFGDFASTALGWGGGGRIEIDRRVYFPHSLGIFYSAITQFIGFPHYGDEYKVMGLAPYGEPAYLEEMRQIVRIQTDGAFKLNLRYFRHHTDNVAYSWYDCAPEVGTLYTNKLADLLGAPRSKGESLEQKHKDMARSAQVIYEEAFFALLHALHARHPCENLALSGGCAMNSVANGKVYLNTPFKKMYLPAAAGDAGGAIGAAAMVAANLGGTIQGPRDAIRTSRKQTTDHRLQTVSAAEDGRSKIEDSDCRAGAPPAEALALNSHLPSTNSASSALPAPRSDLRPPSSGLRQGRPSTLDSSLHPSSFVLRPSPFTPYLGPQFSKDDCWEVLAPQRSQLSEVGCQLSDISDTHTLCRRTAQAIADGKVVGWFQGRMEWGPRALGNRSILGDPRRADMKDILNAKIKRRESFRPFAPSILREQVAEWFEQEDDVPYMMEVFQLLPARRSLLPAVCHVDGSGRLQTVHREINPLYHQLISAFCSLTSVPLVLNTSFNENEPVVCRPEEALACFLRTSMDVLVMGNFFLERKEAPTGNASEEKDGIPREAYLIGDRLAESLNAKEVHLFGSYARGAAGPDSDFDFLVVVPRSDKSRYQRAVDALGLVSDFHVPADIVVVTQAEWERDLTVVCSLASTVRREGILLNER